MIKFNNFTKKKNIIIQIKINFKSTILIKKKKKKKKKWNFIPKN